MGVSSSSNLNKRCHCKVYEGVMIAHSRSITSYTPLRLLVDADEIYTVVYKNAGRPSSTDLNRDLLYSNGSAPPVIPSEKDESLKATLFSLVGNNGLYLLLAKIRQALKTYHEAVKFITDFENDRYRTMALYVSLERRHNRLQEDMSRLLAAAGDVRSVQTELATLQEKLAEYHKCSTVFEIGTRITSEQEGTSALDYLLPDVFLLLPSNVDSWDPSNPQTHTFRIHVLCKWNPGRNSGEVHFHQHGGHAINHLDEFLKHFGHVALSYLKLFKITIAMDGTESNFDTVSDVDETDEDREAKKNAEKARDDARLQRVAALAEGSQFSAAELEDLFNIAIASLQQTVSFQKEAETRFSLARKVYIFLANDSAADLRQGLHPNPEEPDVRWECTHHFLSTYLETDLAALSDHAQSLGGNYHIQLGTAEIKVRSIQDVWEFYDTLNVTKCITVLTVTLLWAATETELREILERTIKVKVHYLRVDGGGLMDHPMYTTEQGSVYVRNIVASDQNNLKMVTFVNGSGQLSGSISKELVAFITDRRITAIDLPSMSSVEWGEFRQFVLTFHKAINEALGDNGDSEHSNGKENKYRDTDVITTLQKLVSANRYIKALAYITETHLAAKFDMPNGVFHGLIETRFPVMFNEQFLYDGTLRGFALEIDGNPDYLSTLGKVLKSNPNLDDVMVQTKERHLLSQIAFCCRYICGRVHPLQITFFDKCISNQERVVAKLVFSSKVQDAVQNSTADPDLGEYSISVVDIEVKEWVMDFASEPLADEEAVVLDKITTQVPNTLASLVLNISRLSRTGIESIRHVLSRSLLQFLTIECNSFSCDLKEHVVLALARIPQSLLTSLVIRGEAVDTWLQLLAEATVSPTSHNSQKISLVPLSQLVQFTVINTATDRQPLSNKAMEAILYVAQSCSLIEFSLVNIHLPVSQQWDIVTEELDMVHLKNLNLVNSTFQNA
ncbi:hypothetical protein BGZ81_005977 [Podila clonocystis]|nr:hypothetical protein BGZ81_005977 [Podila clonocystis]